MSGMLYMRPDENAVLFASVSGTVDSDYDASWLCDGRPGRPVRVAAGSPDALSLTITPNGGPIDLVAITNHTLIVPVTIGDDVTATITPDSVRPPDGIQLGAFEQLVGSPAPASSPASITFEVSGNDEPIIVGEFFAGKARELTPIRLEDVEFSEDDWHRDRGGEFLSIPPYDRGITSRVLRGSQYYTTAELADIKDWWKAQRALSRPSLLIPDPDVNDAWAVDFKGLTYQPIVPTIDAEGLWLVHFEFVEYPRSRW